MCNHRSLLALFLFLTSVAWAGPQAVVIDQGVIFHEDGRNCGWSANYGSWSWGNEVLIPFGVAWVNNRPDATEKTLPPGEREMRLARSLDGGKTWTIESPADLIMPEHGGRPVTPLSRPMPLSSPGFAWMANYERPNTGNSRFWYSLDRGKSWKGPFRFPSFGFSGLQARSDYLIEGPREMTLFQTAFKSNGEQGRPFVARTQDGGLAWKRIGLIGSEPAGYAIMPSTVRLSLTHLVTTVRTRAGRSQTIEAYDSRDNGVTWKHISQPVPDTVAGNPPHLVRLHDGRLLLTYGYRGPPYSIRAKFSPDAGQTWSEDVFLRDDGVSRNLGYTRTIERPDGKILTVYYFTTAQWKESFLAYTLWDANPN